MDSKLKPSILANLFVDKVRTSMLFDDEEFAKLCEMLGKLSLELKGVPVVDKELVLYLYTAPVIVRNLHLATAKWDPIPEICYKLEDAWIDLDALITDCLVD